MLGTEKKRMKHEGHVVTASGFRKLKWAMSIASAILTLSGCERQSSTAGAANAHERQQRSAVPTPIRKASTNQASTPTPASPIEVTPVLATTASPATQNTQPDATVEKDRARWLAELSDIDKKVGNLRERARSISTTQTRERLTQAVTELEEKRRALAEQLDHLDNWRTSASLAWQDVRDGFERAFKELRDAYEKAKSHF